MSRIRWVGRLLQEIHYLVLKENWIAIWEISGDFVLAKFSFLPRIWSAKLYGFVDLSKSNEDCLLQVHKIIGFVPALLQLVMSEQLDMPVRQAGLSSQWIKYFTIDGCYLLHFHSTVYCDMMQAPVIIL